MSRWADDPERAADALIQSCIDDIALDGRVLLANQGGILPEAMRSRGTELEIWNRRLSRRLPALAWPTAGPFDAALLRLPRSKDEVEMSLHALIGALRPGGRLIVYGGNDEGIRSVSPLLRGLCGEADAVAIRGHGRVLAARRPEHAAGLHTTLAGWRRQQRVAIAGTDRTWVSYPGVFTSGRVDDGTALLLSALPALKLNTRLLDFGCGSGIIGAAALAQEPSLTVHMLDNDAIALEAARENVPTATHILGRELSDAPGEPYQTILSNPPLHQGSAATNVMLDRLIAEAPGRLVPGGVLQVVVQRRIPLDRTFAEHFGTGGVVAENGRYRVWRATRG
jgi:16S rRNA (guanine1207-N2)-methyltransferase